MYTKSPRSNRDIFHIVKFYSDAMTPRTFSTLLVPLGCLLLLTGCGKSGEETRAEQLALDRDPTLISSCSFDGVVRVRVLDVSSQETEEICERMSTILRRKPSVRLLRELSKAVSELRRAGLGDEMSLNAHHFMRIAKARGQLNSDDSMVSTFNVVFKIVTGMEGRVTATELAGFMEDLGVDAESMSNQGLLHSAAVLSTMKTGRQW